MLAQMPRLAEQQGRQPRSRAADAVRTDTQVVASRDVLCCWVVDIIQLYNGVTTVSTTIDLLLVRCLQDASRCLQLPPSSGLLVLHGGPCASRQ